MAECTPRLRTAYKEQIAKAMTEKFGYTNPMQVPRIEKVVLNMGVGKAVDDKKRVTNAAEEMEKIYKLADQMDQMQKIDQREQLQWSEEDLIDLFGKKTIH